jgi:UDPglucose 6-dehydrogenase
MRIAMIGGGYVGLVSAACFAEFGSDITVMEVDADKLAALRAGRMPIYEPGLEKLVSENVAAGRLAFTGDLGTAVHDTQAVFIAVGTPTRRGDGHADLSYVYAAAEQVARALTGYAVIITKSTVPVGTSRRIAEIVRTARPDLDFDVASNPEFLREGNAIDDFMRPDRVVIGAESDRARDVLRLLYRPLYLIEAPIVFTGIETAELTKYAANAFLAMKVTFINEMADLCERVGADVHDVARGIGLDGRIGRKFLHPGPGYGGSCFPKDTLALMRTAQDYGAPSRLVAHGDAGDFRMRRLGARQNRCGARADLQAGDRRHARCAIAVDRRTPRRRRRDHPGLRSRGDAAGEAAAAGQCDLLPRCIRCGAGGGRAGGDHGMERVPRPQPDAAARRNARARAGRSSQCL